MIIAKKVYGYESGKAENEFSPRPEAEKPDYRLKERAKAEAKKPDWLNRLLNGIPSPHPNVVLAPIASGDKELADKQASLLEFLRFNYGDALAVENLAFGFLQAAHANDNVLALTVHGISRLIDISPEDTPPESRAIAVQNASAFVFEILAKYKINNAETTKRFQEVLIQNFNGDKLIAEIGQKVELAFSNNTDEYHTQIEYARKLINQGQFNQAVSYLNDLKTKLWHKPDNILKYRLLANLGMAQLGLDEINEAAKYFIEARKYNPEDDKALALAAMGYSFQQDYINAEAFIQKALQENPANELAHSLRIEIAPVTQSIDSVLELIPRAYHDSLDVLVALGVAAKKRGLNAQAEQWWQSALDRNNGSNLNTVKVALGATLMEGVIKNYPLIVVEQLGETEKQSLERAITLFTEVLGGIYVNPNNISRFEFDTLMNRASAFRLLRKYDDAIRDVDIALEKEPNNPDCVKQRALLAHEKGDNATAYQYLQSILWSPNVPEVPLLASELLIGIKRWDEAENILKQFISKENISSNLKRDAKHLKFDLLLLRGEHEKAETMLQEVINEAPDSIITITQQIRFYKQIGLGQKIPSLIEQAKAVLLSNTFLPYQIVLANLLYSFNYYRDAAEIYEQFVDKTLNTKLTRQLLYSYYYIGNYKSAIDICQQLLNKYGSLESVSEMAAYIYDNIGDTDNVIQVCKAYLNIFPDDVVMQLRLGMANYDKHNYNELDLFLDSKPSIKDLKPVSCRELAKLLKFRNRIDYFLEVIYEMRRRFYDNGQIHAFYQISYIEGRKIQPSVKEFTQVEDGCGVLLRDESGSEEWFIVENREDANLARNELNSQQSLYKHLMAKRLRDEIVLENDGFGRKSRKILAIEDKYFAAGKQSFDLLDKLPDIKGFRTVNVPMKGDEISSEWIQQLTEMLQHRKEHSERFKNGYEEGKIPFGLFAIGINRSPIELWINLISRNDHYIHAWSNFQYEKFDNSLSILQQGGLLVIDPISLITLYQLGVANDVVGVLGKFGIAQSTVDLFQGMLEDAQGWNREGFLNLGTEHGQLVGEEIRTEQVAEARNYFQGIIEWVDNNCLILPCRRALDINIDERNKLNEVIGLAFIDTVLIAEEEGRILYSDDQWLRWYAQSKGVQGVWTQVVLRYCLLDQNTNEVLYNKATLQLAFWGYNYTIIYPETLMEGARLANWEVKPSYTLVVKALADKQTLPEYMAVVAAEFIYKLYIEVIIPERRYPLIIHLLNAITTGRSQTQIIHLLVQQLNRIIQSKPIILPTFQDEIQQLIEIWQSLPSIIT
ncbi:PIN domain-containing protein [Anabaena sp. WFMT]|uniref:PIN domain-containing protein n=1 Tax=Anabaena sp. WFMT TaxID=3449730 RepID=UPI003F1EEBDF